MPTMCFQWTAEELDEIKEIARYRSIVEKKHVSASQVVKQAIKLVVNKETILAARKEAAAQFKNK
jgi:hypothetical protein